MTESPRGVTVIICCHDSSKRLGPTLEHLAAQRASGNIPWEVLVIDNASSDGTAELARAVWPAGHPAPLRVIGESRLGLSYARERGLAEAAYEYVSFVDDDNRVGPEWIRTVCDVFDRAGEVGACGGAIEAVLEAEAPRWFSQYEHNFAVGNRGPVGRYTTYYEIWGAGLSLRRSAWEQLRQAGFSPCLTDRRGKGLSSGGDTELCAALTMLGWKLWYDPRLRLEHCMPSGRLTWSYLRRLWRSFGYASVALGWYGYALRGRPATWEEAFRRTWIFNVLWCVYWLARRGSALLTEKEGSSEQIFAESVLGKAQALLSGFRAYHQGAEKVQKLCQAAAGPANGRTPGFAVSRSAEG
ncbi:MAG: glycosyltransferase family 2 protein [Acidobacteriia bacterium]|nr:glycosyltransferase family 2 protein [Terriglobia bacterium]